MTTFWRMDCTSDMDKQLMLDTKTVAWPNDVPVAERGKFAKKMAVGHALVWGRWLGALCRIDGIGLITAVEGSTVSVDWKKVPTNMVSPTTQGLQYWKKKPIFKFDPTAAESYGLSTMLG